MGSAGVLGRERELEELTRLIDELETGARAVVLEGEPGIGKTTLWRELLARGGPAAPSAAPAGTRSRLRRYSLTPRVRRPISRRWR